MLASRARRRVRVVPGTAGSGRADDRAVVDAFFVAAGSGDLSALLAVLAPDAELRGFDPRGTRVLRGADKIAAQARAGARAGLRSGAVLRPVTVRGAAGMLILLHDRPISVVAFTVRHGLITEMRWFNDPDRLAQIIPSWVA
jgi:RNA polymerase sigma-70 factor (ECF subfamily)